MFFCGFFGHYYGTYINPFGHGPFSRPITHGGGGVVRPPHNQYWKWYQKIPLCTHSLPLNFFWKNFQFWECWAWKRHQNFTFFKSFKPKIFIFEYFPKILSEITSTHPFYPILIPNKPDVIFFFILFVGGFQKDFFFIKANKFKIFLYWESQKCSARG